MKIIISMLFLNMIYFEGIGQKKVIQRANAFFSVTIPGMVRKDEKGNIINPIPAFTRFIFLESKCNGKPKIDSVYYNNVMFKASVEEKEDSIGIAGLRFIDEQPIKLTPKKGNHLWKINLTEVNNQSIPNELVKSITIIGKVQNIKFVQKLKVEEQISGPHMY